MTCKNCGGAGGDYVLDGEGEVKMDVCESCEGTGESKEEIMNENEFTAELEKFEIDMDKIMRRHNDELEYHLRQITRLREKIEKGVNKMLEDQANVVSKSA